MRSTTIAWSLAKVIYLLLTVPTYDDHDEDDDEHDDDDDQY